MAAADTTARTEEDILDTMIPRTQAITIAIGLGDNAQEYTQRPLGFFQKMEWYSLVSHAVDDMLQSQGGDDIAITIAGVFGDGLKMNNLQDMSSLVSAFTKLSAEVPDFLLDSYCIWLGVPRERREWARYQMGQPPEEGGLTDEQGMLILETFADQNLEAIKAFFAKEGPAVVKRMQSRLGLDNVAVVQKESSKPSRATRRATPKK